MAWEAEFEPILDNPITYQGPNVIDSGAIFEKSTPPNPENQKTGDGRNLNIDPVIDHPISRNVGHGMVTEQNFDLLHEGHAEGNEKPADPT